MALCNKTQQITPALAKIYTDHQFTDDLDSNQIASTDFLVLLFGLVTSQGISDGDKFCLLSLGAPVH